MNFLHILTWLFLNGTAHAQEAEQPTCGLEGVEEGAPVLEWYVDEEGEAGVIAETAEREDVLYRVDYRLSYDQDSVFWSTDIFLADGEMSWSVVFDMPEEAWMSVGQGIHYSQVHAVLVVMGLDGREVYEAGAQDLLVRIEGGMLTDVIGWEEMLEGGGLSEDGELGESGMEGVIITAVAPPG